MDRLHSVIDNPHHYRLVQFIWNTGVNDPDNAFIEMYLEKDGQIRKLRFLRPVDVKIDHGFRGSLSGMEILDIRSRQLDDIGVLVRNFEQDAGVTFLAHSVIEVD